jgi:hypothetical protein
MRRIFLLAIWVVLIEGAAHANEVAFFQTDSAVADFISIDAPCITTSASVFASNQILRFDQTATSGAFITVHRRDHCSGVDLIDAVGAPVFLADEFVVAKNRKGASLNALIAIHDFVSGTTLPVHVQLKWTRTSRLIRSWTLSRDDFVFIVAKEANKTYLATVSGAITASSENFTPYSTQNAAISGDQNMFVIRR